MCWSGSRLARRATTSQNTASKSLSATWCSSFRRTPCTHAASSSASCRGEPTPDSASRSAAWAISARSSEEPDPAAAGPAALDPAGFDPAGFDPVDSVLDDSAIGLRPSVPSGRELRGGVRVHAGLDHGVQIPVQNLVEVVRLVPDPVVGDAVLGEVVRADPLGPVHGADLALARVGGLLVGLLL